METKGVTCKIPLDLHNRISEEIREMESTMSKFIEMIIREHYERGAEKSMGKNRTLAFQVSEELFQRVKEYLERYEQVYGRRLTQREFIIGLIEQALEEAEEEFEAARAAVQEEQAANGWESGEPDEDTLPRWILHRLGTTEQTLERFVTGDRRYILYIQYDREGIPSLCTASRKTSEQLHRALWDRKIPVILTSGTLMAGGSFDRTIQRLGLFQKGQIKEYVANSPFRYEENCLLYLPGEFPKVRMGSKQEIQYLTEQICQLVKATYGHTLVLFTSYSLMSAVYNLVKEQLTVPLLEVWRHSQDIIYQFKQLPNAVLFAAGSCWEGVDFPGDMVSSLIIVRLPFPVPDPLREAEREQYPTLQEYIREVILPDMQVKLRQGFGRAIRTETDTCVVSILDYRAAPGERYHQAVLEALPPLPTTQKIKDVEKFIRARKGPDYFI